MFRGDGAPRPVVLVGHADAAAQVRRLSGALHRAGHPVTTVELSGLQAAGQAPGVHMGAVVVLLVTRAVEPCLAGLLHGGIGRLLPVVLDDPTDFGWGRLDELLYLDLRGAAPDLVDAAVVRALERFAGDGPVTRLPRDEFVFISYAFADDVLAARVEQHLRRARFSTFRATDLLFGADWLDLMDRAVTEAWLVVALISPAYLRSFWCYEEFKACPAERRMLVEVGSTPKLDGVRDEWYPMRVDLTGLPEPAFGARLLAAVAHERSLTARERADRAEREKPPVRSTSYIDVAKSWVPWEDDLLDRKVHPQLRGRPSAARATSSLSVRRQAANDFMAGRS